MNKYTFTFAYDQERRFRSILDRLDPDEYEIVSPIAVVQPEGKTSVDERYADRSTIISMEEDAALTFRMGMRDLKISKERTEEEARARKELEDRNKVTVVVKVNPV